MPMGKGKRRKREVLDPTKASMVKPEKRPTRKRLR